ncbi:Uncharacterised protein [Mycobacteroides abscessus]|nr:hypothetical protein [Mycobacteroides abscessus]CPZ68600.1 Uncharacterised protein [Mycobacteroides abscessus]CQA08113.1 Uncharacterised protein [Mycobacteroides abscessus]
MSVGKYENVGDDEAGPGDTLNVSESTDSDEMRLFMIEGVERSAAVGL